MSRDETLVHQALLYGDEDQFLSAAVPFLKDGLEDGGAVLAVVAEDNIMALKGTMGRDATPITFVGAEGFYQHPVQTIANYSRIVQETLPKRVWALAEPVWRGWNATQTKEWKRYEAVVNAAFETSGAQVICAYNTRTTSDDVLESTSATHPTLIEGQGKHRSRAYIVPSDFTVQGDRDPLPSPEALPDVLPLGESLDDLRALRLFLTERASHHKLPPAVINKFLMTAVEIATNAIKHGAPPLEARVWTEDRTFYCEVFDYGHWHPDPLIGHIPQETGLGNFGLWSVRLLAETVQIRTGWTGTTVRLSFTF